MCDEMHKRNGHIKTLESLLSYLDSNDLQDVINYIGIILRKKEAEGKFDYLKTIKDESQ